MKLGIVVVYLVDYDNLRLLNIHLNQIKNKTLSDYTIYANINMLSHNFIDYLRHPKIKLVKTNDYIGKNDGLRATYELAHYAENLIRMAIEDGSTHIAMLHPDSFPVKKGWEKTFEKKLSNGVSLISTFPAISSIMFFSSDFYRKLSPKLIPNKKELRSKNYKKFVKSINAERLLEPGFGYAYQTKINGLKWEILERTNLAEDHYHYGSIFEDSIFHLGAAEHDDRSFANSTEKESMKLLKRFFGLLIPPVLKEKIKTSSIQTIIKPEIQKHKYYHTLVKEKLYKNPNEYIKYLRLGK